jgi:hypothetical protein
MEILQQFTLNFVGMLEYFHKTLVVCWSISIKLWWYVGVFPLNFGGIKFNGNTPTYHQRLMEYSNIPPKFNGNTPTYQQRLMEILQHTNKV